MSDVRDTDEQNDDPAYEPPTVEVIGSVEELAKGNEGSTVDGVTQS